MYFWSSEGPQQSPSTKDRPQVDKNENQNWVYSRRCQARQVEISKADRSRREDYGFFISWKEQKSSDTNSSVYGAVFVLALENRHKFKMNFAFY